MTTVPKTSRSRRSVLTIVTVLVVAVIAIILWSRLHTGSPAAPEEEEAVTVTAQTLSVSPFQPQFKAYGELRAIRGVELAAEVGGIVDRIYFTSGQHVAKGAPLLRLRLNDDPAKLAAIEANVALWRANLTRDVLHLEAQAVSRASVDVDRATLRNYQAEADAQRAVIAQKTVRAPFSGQVGLRQVDLGQYLTAGDAIESLQALGTLLVDFNVPQQQFSGLRNGQAVQVSLDAYPSRRFSALLTAIDSRLDKGNRMTTARATMPNPDGLLRPGMFVVIDVPVGASRPALLAPSAAITYSPSGDYVYVIEPPIRAGQPRRARLRAVTLGDKQNDQVLVSKGLHAGEQVITAGQVKLRDGAAVRLSASTDAPR